MRRSIAAVVLAFGGTIASAGLVAAEPVSQPASCAGYLAAWASPNNGWIIQTIVRPTATDLGVTVGALTSSFAEEHGGSLEACIP